MSSKGYNLGYAWMSGPLSPKKDFNAMSIADQFIELRKQAVSDDDRYLLPDEKRYDHEPNHPLDDHGQYIDSYFDTRTGTMKRYSFGETSLKAESLKARTKKDFGQVDIEYLGRVLDEIRKQAEKNKPNKSKLTNLCNKLDREACAIVSESTEVVRAKDDLLTKYRTLQEVNKRHVKEKNQLGSKNNTYKK